MKTFRLLSCFTTFALAFVASHLGASPILLLPAGSEWRYLADGSDLGTVWREVSFDDSAWAAGRAQLGWADGDEVTVIQSQAVTVYFRRTFQSQIADPASLTLRLLRDDGAVVYINGVEVFRSNVPPGPVSYNTLASAAVGGAQETTEFVTASIDPGVLMAGVNLVAVEVHQVNVTSSDLSFDLELLASTDPPPPVNQRPYVQLNEPQNGDVFTAPTNIVLRAFAQDREDGHEITVEFLANGNSLGFGTFVPTLCPAPYCPFYQLIWTNPPAGNYTLVARATDSAGASSNSAPVSITVHSSEPGTNVTLIANGSIWKYLDNGSDQGTAWREPAFDDSTWASGPGQLGYGDGDEATVVGYGPEPANKYITTYFRRSFHVANAASFSELRGRLLQDDGGAVYLNGVEIFRSNLPQGPIAFNTPATFVSPENQIVDFSAPASLLVNGMNVVAVEMHQVNVNSSDLSFELELLGERSSTPTNEPPYVQLNEPRNGDVFTAPANIVLRAYAQDAEDGYDLTVEFFAGGQNLGPGTFVPTRCATPYCPYYELTWSNPPPGNYTLIARATDSAGASSNSTPVSITVRPQDPGPIIPAPYDQEHPAVASDGSGYLVVWMDRRNGSEYDIYGARVSASGQVLDPAGIPICTAPTSQWYPSVAFDGNNFLVVWSDGREHSNDNPRLDVFGARVSSTGTVLDPNGIQITHGEVVGQPTVAFNGTDYLVAGYVWEHNGVRGTTLLGVRVAPSALVHDHEELIINQAGPTEYPAIVASVGGDWLVVWNGTGVEGARVSPAGNVTPLSTVLQQGFVAINGLAAGSSNYFLTTMDNRQLTEDTYVQDIFGTWISRDGRALRTILIAANTNRSIGSAGGQPTTFKQEHPTAAFNGAELMVVWDAGDMYYNGGNHMFQSDIRAARVDASGNVWPVISVCDAPQNQSHPAIAFNGQHFLGVWQDARSAPPEEYSPSGHFDIYGARMAAAGGVLEQNGFLISGARSNQPPVVTMTSPADGATFDVDAPILLAAVATDRDGGIRSVDFLANGQSIYGPLTEPNQDNTYYLIWSDLSPGDYILTAKATDNSGASSVSEPVNITVREQPTSGRELHAVGIHNGRTANGTVTQQDGHAAVLVDRPGKQVTLFLSAYWPVRWHVTVSEGTIIEKVILGGYETQTIEGINTNVPVQRLYGSSQYLIEYEIDSVEFQQVQAKLCALTGMDMSSFHGSSEAPYPAPFVIDAVQDDPRLRCDYPQPVDPSELPNLSFRLSFHDGSSGNVVHQDYTLAGPQNALRLLPAYRVVSDAGNRYYYGAEQHQVWRVDTQTSTVQEMDLGPNVPELSWPMGVAFDSQRNRVLVVSLGGEGYLYAYSPAQAQWSLVSSMDNRDVDSLVYHAADDSLYALTTSYYDRPYLLRFSADGAFQSRTALPVQPFNIFFGGGFRSELASVGDYLVLLLETDPFYSYYIDRPEAQMYLIDPRTGEHWLAYRRVAGFDTDRDGVPDERDYCPNTPLYAAVDSDGCSADQRDSDNDGVPDSGDQCLGTAPGVVVNSRGCSLAQLCPCDGPWRNHAEYVGCVIRHAWAFFRAGLITRDQRREAIHDAVQSDCGKRPDRREAICIHLFPLSREECQRDGLQFVISGDANANCILECSEDLVNWRPIEPVSVTGWEVTCPLEPGIKARLYRVRADE